jgi:hypothetical protein
VVPAKTKRYVDKSLVKLETERGKKGKTDNQYKVARACMEGWFPKIAWSELNQTWAGLGQLLNKKEERKSCRVRQLAVHAVDR